MQINIKQKIAGAVDIGGTKISLGIVSETGRVLGERKFPTVTGKDSAKVAMDEMIESLSELCQVNQLVLSELQGIGIVCAGPVDKRAGVVKNPYTLPGWEFFELTEYVSKKTGLKTRLEHDVNGALLGEVFLRKLEKQRVLMASFGTGIGVAVYDYDKPFEAGYLFHPEMGHVLADINGPDCYCGHKGCFESLWSGSALNRRAKENGYNDFDDLYSAWLAREGKACPLMEKITLQYRNGMWNLMIIFKPQIVVLGGGLMKKYFSFAEGLLRDDLDRAEAFVEPFKIYPAGGFGDSALVGASRLIL